MIMLNQAFKVPVHLGDLRGPGGNAFMILGQVKASFKALDRPDFSVFQAEATSGDYEHLLDTVLDYCDDLDGSVEYLREGDDDE